MSSCVKNVLVSHNYDIINDVTIIKPQQINKSQWAPLRAAHDSLTWYKAHLQSRIITFILGINTNTGPWRHYT